MYKYKTYFKRKITLHVAQIANTDSYSTLYSRNMVCFRYVIVNTLHKGEMDDDDDDDDDNNNNKKKKKKNNNNNRSWDSIVNIATGLQAGLSRVWLLANARVLYLLETAQTIPGAQPAS